MSRLPSVKELVQTILGFEPADKDVDRYEFVKVTIADIPSWKEKGYTVAEHTRAQGHVILWRLRPEGTS